MPKPAAYPLIPMGILGAAAGRQHDYSLPWHWLTDRASRKLWRIRYGRVDVTAAWVVSNADGKPPK